MKETLRLFVLCITVFGLTAPSISCSEERFGAGIDSGRPVNKKVEVTIDKALYNPGEQIQLSVPKKLAGNVVVRYKYLSQLLEEQPLSDQEWTWKAPSEDFRGYLVEIVDKNGDEETILGTIGIDVSSDWKKFPRYGFLSSFDQMSDNDIEYVISTLNRYHINGLQYYDWLYKHHKPLAGTPEMPMEEWPDIFKRITKKSTTLKYIETGHKYGMKSMMYNLCYGAWKDAEEDGVDAKWHIFRDKNLQDPDKHELTYGLSDIFLVDPGLAQWQDYLAKQNEDVYKVYNFDGFHIDQLGWRLAYNYLGAEVNFPNAYLSFMKAMKGKHPEKRIVMNAVSEFGQAEIAQANPDFLYNEVWEGTTYNDYVRIIKDNLSFNNNKLPTVFAAYSNYDYAKSGAKIFNTPGVLFANAVIFAHGGAHLELGEHMLSSEYFPSSNLKMSDELSSSLRQYYDFLVAYQNILRDGGEFNSVNLTCTDSKMNINQWPAQLGSVAVSSKLVDNRQVIHLINFSTAKTLDGRDANGEQTEPSEITAASLNLASNKPLKSLWVASPDINGGAAQIIRFEQNGSNISFTLPYLKYWSMIVAEY